MSAISSAGSERPRLHMDVGRAGARRAADAARGMAGRLQAQLPRRGAVEQPAGQPAAVDQPRRPGRHPLAVERLGAEAAPPVRIVDDDDVGSRTSPPPRGRAGSWSCGRSPGRSSRRADGRQAAADARIEQDRHRPARQLAGIEPLHRALAGAGGRSSRARRDRHRWRTLWLAWSRCMSPPVPAITLAEAL